MESALSGLRVLDLSTGLAGSFGATLLGDFGAEVIKVEEPVAGNPLRHYPPFYQGYSLFGALEGRNKKSVSLALPEEKEAFLRLAAASDVIVESYSPGTLEKWGLGYDVLNKVNPGLVLARISPFGQEGPYRDRPGDELIAQAFGGLTYFSNYSDGTPVRAAFAYADYLAWAFAALSSLIALHWRRRSRLGQVIDLALYEPVLRIQVWGKLAEYSATGQVSEVGRSHGSGVYRTGDGHW